MSAPPSSPPRPGPRQPGAASPNGGSPRVAQPTRTLAVSRGVQVGAQKIVIYGTGGSGKTELCSLLNMVGVEPLFLDLENGSKFLDVARTEPETWDELRGVLHDSTALEPFGAVVVDSLTKAEELDVAWVLANIKHEKGDPISSIEDYGWGKGYTHSYETMLQLLCDMDAVVRSGRHAICVCHDCTSNVPNPAGQDWLRYEPRLQSPASGKFSIRHRVKEWADHLLFIGYDVVADKEGKAKGSGSRAIYTQERPTLWAKSRSINETVPYAKGDPRIWNLILGKE
jgi:hypothetical protein